MLIVSSIEYAFSIVRDKLVLKTAIVLDGNGKKTFRDLFQYLVI
jgi:hypothetical protein